MITVQLLYTLQFSNIFYYGPCQYAGLGHGCSQIDHSDLKKHTHKKKKHKYFAMVYSCCGVVNKYRHYGVALNNFLIILLSSYFTT